MAVEGASVALFGGVACSVGSQHLPLPPGKPSVLLALLALEAGRLVRISAVIDGLWEDDPPSSARALVHTYVSALRRALDAPGAPQIATVPGGYRLDCEPQVVDVHRVLTSAGSDDPSVWEAALADSGEPLLGGLEIEFAEPWQVRIDAARDLLQDRVWSRRLEEGGAAEVLPELRAAVGREPLREDRVLLLARALAEVGRVDDALRTLDTHRRRLGEELGLDPSAAVPALRQQLLIVPRPAAEHPAITGPAAIPMTPGRRWRNLAILAAVVVTVLASLVWRWVHNPALDPVDDLTGPGLLEVDPASGSVVDSASLPITPFQIEADGDVVWVRSVEDHAVAVLDLSSGDEADVTGMAAPPSALAVDNGAAVVGLGFSGETVTVTEGQVGPPTPAVEGSAGRLTLAGSDDGVWVATITGDIHAPPGTTGWPRPVSIGALPYRLDVDGAKAWVIAGARAELVAVASSDGAPVHSPLRGVPVDLTTGAGQAWAVTSGDDRLWHAAESGRVVATRVLPGTPTAVLATGETIWVALTSPPALASYDAESLEPGITVDLPREPVDLALSDGRLVVAVR